MPRPKKDGHYINYYIARDVYDNLQAYAKEKGQTTTVAIERILRKYFDEQGFSTQNVGDIGNAAVANKVMVD